MEALLTFVGTLAPWVQLTVCIILIAVFRKEIVELIRSWLGIKRAEAERQELVPIWAQTLMQHFNHETTDNQEAILENQSSMAKDVSKLLVAVDDIRINGVRIRK